MKRDKRIRTVKVNERGQIVIPEEIRRDFGIDGSSTLVLIEGNEELILRKEADVLSEIEHERTFWKGLSEAAIKRAWSKEDEIWDAIYRKAEK